MFRVKKSTLLLIACLVWGAAGFNVLRIGVLAYPPYLTPLHLLLSGVVFGLFQTFVFGRLVRKHTARIAAMPEERPYFWTFFDRKSFLIMAVMMSGGIGLRASGLAPDRFIAVFYSGLGASLLLAGLLFGAAFVSALHSARVKSTAPKPVPYLSPSALEVLMKHTLHSAWCYAVLALLGGVFFREFTKFYGFTGKTTLSVIHTHYFVLGTFFFLLLFLLARTTSFPTPTTKRVLVVYHVGLNLTVLMLAVRGITQVLQITLPSGPNAALSGMAGIGHILLGVSLLLLLRSLTASLPSSPKPQEDCDL